MAEPQGIARLARNGIYQERLGCKKNAETDCDQRDLSAGLDSDARPCHEGSRKPFVGARATIAIASGIYSRPGVGDQWVVERRNRRQKCFAISTRGIMGRAHVTRG